MKAIINWVVGVGMVLPSVQALSADAINVYHAPHADAMIIDSGGKKIFKIVGGAIPRGAATAGDCFAKANIGLKKSPNYYEGDLEPVSNELLDVTSAALAGKEVGLYIFDDHIRVGNVEVDGVCADGIDLSGNYKKIQRGNKKYKYIFIYFMRLADQEATHLEIIGDGENAKKELEPFIRGYRREWNFSSGEQEVIEKTSNDYRRLTGK